MIKIVVPHDKCIWCRAICLWQTFSGGATVGFCTECGKITLQGYPYSVEVES